MTLRDRADAYAVLFPDRPPLQVVREQARDVIYGTWLGGQDYRNASKFYGAYPPGYLERVMALFPDVTPSALPTDVLHVFSGSLPPGHYERCDLLQPAEIQADVCELPNIILNWRPRLVIADPPYSAADADKYRTPPLNRRRALESIARITQPGGHLVWLDCVWPMHNKQQWVTVGRITLIRSTNHRVRLVSIFERVAA
ncbi:MAG: hypothetical protein ABI634_12810 [Acidobacteriota bacterium]